MERVLLIGSGKRVQENFLPALRCLAGDFSIVGVHSRTPVHYRRVAETFHVPPIDQVDGVILSRTDVVIISAPPKVWIEWLPLLLPQAQRLTLVIDTPLRLFHPDLLPKLARFKRVQVTEDYLAFPRFELLREFCASGTIGAIQKIRLAGNGYRYHGTALIRSFLTFGAPLYVRSKKHRGGAVDLFLRFPGAVEAEMLEPYVPETGHIDIIGARGSVTSRDDGTGFTHRIVPIRDEHGLAAFEIKAGAHVFRRELAHLRMLRTFPAQHDFETEKTHGLIAVLESLVRPNVFFAYDFEEALYEEWLSETPRIASMRFFDPFVALGTKPFRSRWYWLFLRFFGLGVRLKRRLEAMVAHQGTD